MNCITKELERVKNAQCVGCGYCCMKTPCGPALGFTSDEELLLDGQYAGCPFLYWNGKRYRCRLIEIDPLVKKFLGVGEGCSSPMFNSRRNRFL